jgi:hypothetical protein
LRWGMSVDGTDEMIPPPVGDGAAREHPGNGPETGKGDSCESSIPHSVQSSPHHLPVL